MRPPPSLIPLILRPTPLTLHHLTPMLNPTRLNTTIAQRRVHLLARSLTTASGTGDGGTAVNTVNPASVACVIIGDEVLGGKTLDTNSHFLAKKCFDHGLDLKRIVVVPDITEDIAQTVREMSASYGIVFTSGGIGPTHDDITYPSIAHAFSLPLHHDTRTLELMRKLTPRKDGKEVEMTDARKRMAWVPYGEEVKVVHPCEGLWVPVVGVRNVWILPGIPRLFERLLTAVLPTLLPPASSHPALYIRVQIGTILPESTIAPALTSIQARAAPDGIKVGSYPKWQRHPVRPGGDGLDGGKGRPGVVVSLVGTDREVVERWAEVVRGEVDGWVVEGDED
ncbi:molybdopterin binding domain protein [Fimicolochytrium jonesii]|uniref:molybdopterin binding domain protein n=1 Tax=Fimicolochytrium jonesii TaxID=1396493 RepID=UPI0022FF355F|nr:molybdopterin binding domain protein [Fimicolochytrium jonesii]KAI8827190.1 molybdopterin binding domain protein [Fimicolochytrium jonesii]